MPNIICVDNPPTKDKAAQLLGLKVYDTALPQGWLDEFVDVVQKQLDKTALYHAALSSLVWCYDGGSFIGYPHPLTIEAYGWLMCYDRFVGTGLAQDHYNVLNIGA